MLDVFDASLAQDLVGPPLGVYPVLPALGLDEAGPVVRPTEVVRSRGVSAPKLWTPVADTATMAEPAKAFVDPAMNSKSADAEAVAVPARACTAGLEPIVAPKAATDAPTSSGPADVAIRAGWAAAAADPVSVPTDIEETVRIVGLEAVALAEAAPGAAVVRGSVETVGSRAVAAAEAPPGAADAVVDTVGPKAAAAADPGPARVEEPPAVVTEGP